MFSSRSLYLLYAEPCSQTAYFKGEKSHYFVIPFQLQHIYEHRFIPYMKKIINPLFSIIMRQAIPTLHKITYILIFWTVNKYSNNCLSFTQLCFLPTVVNLSKVGLDYRRPLENGKKKGDHLISLTILFVGPANMHFSRFLSRY